MKSKKKTKATSPVVDQNAQVENPNGGTSTGENPAFRRTNQIIGAILFLLTTIVYWLTVEPTASFWDCGEFISVSYKLEVPHPPGAPLFLIIGRLFSLLAMGDVEQVAYWINISSVLASGGTIAFLYWSIIMLGRKIIGVEKGQETTVDQYKLIGAGIVGSLAFAFTDSFWWSAVETEVYAMSSLFTAVVVWAILKWEMMEDQAEAKKWLLLIAYLVGLSTGIHLLNLVALPALGLIYYYKNYKFSWLGLAAAMGVSLLVIGFIMSGIITGLPKIAGGFELFFVNSIGLPFGTGAAFFLVLLIAGIVYGIHYSIKHQKPWMNTGLLALSFILIGYSSYVLVLIRSDYNPPIDENNPENIMSFISYLERKQYGSRPLLYGPLFTAELQKQEKGSAVYTKGDDEYVIVSHEIENVFDKTKQTLLPRAWSRDHAQRYQDIIGLRPGETPTFGENIYFMLKHQMGHMYWRYFLWNFSGRSGDYMNDSALTFLNATEAVPDFIAENKARNNYWMLPLLLGIMGLLFQWKQHRQGFFVVALLWLFTGLALIVYLNSPPTEPRERDYIYVGSFYAFSFWIGFGVLQIADWMQKFLKGNMAPIAATAISLIVPGILIAENWDDHDRSGRYFSVDSAKNYLASCAPNAILFTGGDNDTFPLWYAQEVEGFRTDVRVVVLSYFNTDWYVDQMTRQAYESEPFPFSLEKANYQEGTNDYVPFVEHPNIKGAIDLNEYISLIKTNNQALKMKTGFGDQINILPSKTLVLKISEEEKAAIRSRGLIPGQAANTGGDFLESADDPIRIVDQMVFNIKGSGLYKGDLMILDLLANNKWERPIYFNTTSLSGVNLDLKKYTVQEGATYRLLPIENARGGQDMLHTDIMYDNIMNNFSWRGLNDPSTYNTNDYRIAVINHRSYINTLAEALMNEGDNTRAKEVLAKSLEVMPDNSIPYDYATPKTMSLFYRLGETAQADEMADVMSVRANEVLAYLTLNETNMSYKAQLQLGVMEQVMRYLKSAGQDEKAAEVQSQFMVHYGHYQGN